METVDSSLLSFIFSSMSRGTVFFAEDLEGSGFSPDEIRWSLTRIVRDQNGVIRLARGVFCIPEQADVSGKLLIPSLETIAYALARRWKVRIAPYGAQAAYLAGFTEIQTHQNIWVSDGSDQVFHLQNGQEIRFVRRLSLKVFQFRSERMRNLSEAMRFLGKDYIQAEGRGVISDNLLYVSDEEFNHDIYLCPLWIREILKELR